MNFMNAFEKQYTLLWCIQTSADRIVNPNEVLKDSQSVILISAFVVYFTDTCFECKFSISLVGCG